MNTKFAGLVRGPIPNNVHTGSVGRTLKQAPSLWLPNNSTRSSLGDADRTTVITDWQVRLEARLKLHSKAAKLCASTVWNIEIGISQSVSLRGTPYCRVLQPMGSVVKNMCFDEWRWRRAQCIAPTISANEKSQGSDSFDNCYC